MPLIDVNSQRLKKKLDSLTVSDKLAMLVVMGRLQACGIPGLKLDAFTYTAVIDAWAKNGYRGAATKADQLLEKMETKYIEGNNDLKPNTCELFAYFLDTFFGINVFSYW